MKRVLFTSLVLLAMLAATAGVAFAGSALELVAVRNDGGGPTFVFRVVGEFSREELESGFVQVEGGDTFPLYCQQVDAETVLCHTSKMVGGQNVVAGFGGARFWTKMPGPHQSKPSYCYSIWDWWFDTGFQWTDFGPRCQDESAQLGDWIEYDTGFGYEGEAVFFDVDVSGGCGGTVPYNGPAYYYPVCPPT